MNIPLKGGGESTGRSSLCAGATSLFFTGPIFVQKGQAEKYAARGARGARGAVVEEEECGIVGSE